MHILNNKCVRSWKNFSVITTTWTKSGICNTEAGYRLEIPKCGNLRNSSKYVAKTKYPISFAADVCL